jgi:formylglycine-generating enzyme required for sulfatase activity
VPDQPVVPRPPSAPVRRGRKIASWAAVATVVVAAMPGQGGAPIASGVPAPDLVELRPGAFQYRPSGDFSRDGRPATAPTVTAVIPRWLAVMRHQVTEAEYRPCVAAGACPTADRSRATFDRPVVGVSWHLAEAYAAWLSDQTGVRFRLPTDEEWAYAAAGRFTGDALPDGAPGTDPGARALAGYEADLRSNEAVDREPRPVGSFGVNENGLADLAGNVWEWTDTCFTRHAIDQRGVAVATTINCGVRVVEGRHRAYVTDFIRDPRSGGCSIGRPPSNLGFRLVRDDEPRSRSRSVLERARHLMRLGP